MLRYRKEQGDKLGELIKKHGVEFTHTKHEMAEYLINLINFEPNSVICEPCRGSCAFYDNFPSNCIKTWCEIKEGKDYLLCNEKCDYTISNPPFVPRSIFWKFHLKAMELTKKEIYWLINMYSLNVFTPNRLQLMKDKGWFINGFHVVIDKRWRGRYVFIKFSKVDNGFITWNKKVF
jgi:hypothetical protein